MLPFSDIKKRHSFELADPDGSAVFGMCAGLVSVKNLTVEG